MIFDGKLVRSKLVEELKGKFEGLDASIAVIQVGDDFASGKYINQKRKLAEDLGIKFDHIGIESATTEELCDVIDRLNEDKNVHGIIVQLPLPKNIDYETIRNRVSPNKDVDGAHDVNILRLFNNSPDALVPCTALGIMKIFDFYNIDLEGKDITIIGRSIHIGKALYSLLLNRNATVTLCHSKTKDVKKHTKKSDIIITSVGKADFLTKDMVKKGSILVDVGFNFKDGKICGDICSDVDNYKYITPVPGGVGPMTVYCIYENLYKAYHLLKKEEKDKGHCLVKR